MTEEILGEAFAAVGVVGGDGFFAAVVDVEAGMLPGEEVDAELARLEAGRGVAIAKRLRWRLRYLSDGAVIGQRSFVDEVFRQCREQFSAKRRDGARRMRGDAADLTKTSGLWSLRDLGNAG